MIDYRFKLKVLLILKIKRRMAVKSYDIVDVVFFADVGAVVVVEVVVLIDALHAHAHAHALHVLDMRMKRVRENIIT